MRVGRTLLVGFSSRTNQEGIAALTDIVGRYGYRVLPVPVTGCLHLKTACTALPDEQLLINPAWLDTQVLRGFELRRIPKEEPWAANILCVGNTVCMSASHVRTAEIAGEMGFDVALIDVSEFAKAEGGVTCLSILLS